MKKDKKIIINIEEHKNRFSLTILFSLIIFAILLASILLTALIVFILSKLEVMSLNDLSNISATPFFLLLSTISVVIGFAISMLLMKIPLKPINQLINKTNRLASGDFKARLEFS